MGLGYGGKQKGVELELWAGVIREAQTDEFEEAVASHHTRDQYPSALIIVSSTSPMSQTTRAKSRGRTVTFLFLATQLNSVTTIFSEKVSKNGHHNHIIPTSVPFYPFPPTSLSLLFRGLKIPAVQCNNSG